MAKTNIKFNNKSYSIDSSLLADATARLEAHLMDMMENSEVLEGDGQEFHKFAPAALTFRSTAPLNELQEVQINGVAIDPSNYTTEEGSTVITLPIEYLKTFDADNYEISVVSENKSVSGGFSVVEPELNEHGFYYNQPYTATVPSIVPVLGGWTVAFFVREDGTFDSIAVGANTETGTYEINGNEIIAVSPLMGQINCTISADGTAIYCSQIDTNFILGDEAICADNDYIYIYNAEANGYVAQPIEKNKSYYAPIKTGITNIPTTAFNIDMFRDNTNLMAIPKIPDSVWGIANTSFYGCTNLTEVVVPDSITAIGTNAFSGCTQLNSVVLPSGLQELFSGIFYGCVSLTSITFKGTIEDWNKINKMADWLGLNVPATHVQCLDGDVAL